VAVKKRDSHNNFSHDDPNDFFCEGDLLLAKVKVEIAHGQILHYYVDVLLILKGFLDAYQEIEVPDLPDELALQ